MGRLTIPAPRQVLLDSLGGGSAGPRRDRASTSLSGEVSRGNAVDALIQLAGRLPRCALAQHDVAGLQHRFRFLADQLLEQAL